MYIYVYIGNVISHLHSTGIPFQVGEGGEFHEYSAPGEYAVCKIRILMENSWL
jgi:hypothetical protein